MEFIKRYKTASCAAVLGAATLTPLGAADVLAADSMQDKLDIGVSLNMDAFFGANPFLGGSYSLDDGSGKSFSTDLTFYGIQWGFGTGSDWGQWTEAGAGMNFGLFDGQLNINPQLGFTFGNLLSSGVADDGVVGDGIVPNMTINLDTPRFIGQGYAGFYLPLRDEADESAGESTNRYIHWWINLGYKINSILSVGGHVEELFLDGGSNVGSVDGYFWYGPFIQVAKDNAGMRLSFGTDTTDDSSSFSVNDFYKLQFFYNF